MEDSGRVDNEGSSAFEKVNLMEELFKSAHRQI